MISSPRFWQDTVLIGRFLRPYRTALTGLIFIMALVGLTTAVLNYLIKWMMDDLIIQPQLHLIPLFCTIVALVYFVRSVFMYFSTHTSRWIGAQAVDRVRREIFDHIIHQPMAYFQAYPSGQLSARLVHDAEVLEQGMTNALTDLFLESFKAIGVLGYLLWLNWKMTVLSSSIFPLMVLPVIYFGRRLRSSTDLWHESLAALSHYLLNAIRGVRTIQAYRGETRESARFTSFSRATLGARRQIIRWQALHSPFVEVALGFGMVVLIVLGSWEIRAGTMTPGGFTSFVSGLFLIYTPIRKLSRANALLQEMATAAERIYTLKQRDERIPEPSHPKPCPRLNKALVIDHVWFSYTQQNWVLKDLSIVFPRGSITALVGPSGAGKSTLVHLIPRFFDVQKGAVRFDDVDIRDISLMELRGAIGWVPQEPFIFSGTVYHNIAYGHPEAKRDRVETAARKANAEEFILKLSHGYDTQIGEGGQTLSGGQWQRISLARALLMNPQVLILDEATSALDSESESLIQRALLALKGRCTVIIIAHRWSTVRLADSIVVLNNGQCLDSGTHETLVERCSLYRRLWKLQTQPPRPIAAINGA